jgi:hypothetical protein
MVLSCGVARERSGFFEFFDCHFVVGKRISLTGTRLRQYVIARSILFSVKAGLHGRNGRYQRTFINVHIEVSGRAQLGVAKEFLRHFQVASRFQHRLGHGVTE